MSALLFALVEVDMHRSFDWWRDARRINREYHCSEEERAAHDLMREARERIGWWRSMWGVL